MISIFFLFQIEMAHETCHLKELGGYSLLQCKPCLVKDLLCVAVGETIRVYSGIYQNGDNKHYRVGPFSSGKD